jgi:hypothetical protein
VGAAVDVEDLAADLIGAGEIEDGVDDVTHLSDGFALAMSSLRRDMATTPGATALKRMRCAAYSVARWGGQPG